MPVRIIPRPGRGAGLADFTQVNDPRDAGLVEFDPLADDPMASGEALPASCTRRPRGRERLIFCSNSRLSKSSMSGIDRPHSNITSQKETEQALRQSPNTSIVHFIAPPPVHSKRGEG